MNVDWVHRFLGGDEQGVPIKRGQKPPPCSEGAALGALDFVHFPRLFSAGQEPVSPVVPSLWSVNYSEECFHFLQEKEGPVLWLFFAFLGTAFFSGMLWQTKETGFVLKRMEVLHSSAFHSGG